MIRDNSKNTYLFGKRNTEFNQDKKPFNQDKKPFNQNNNIENKFTKPQSDKFEKKSPYENRLIIDQIKNWVKNINSTNIDISIDYYERHKELWVNNLAILLKELTRKHRIEVLEKVLHKIKSSDNNTIKHFKNFTLLNDNVWFGRNDEETENSFNEVIQTYELLKSHGYYFFELSTIGNHHSGQNEIDNIFSDINSFYLCVVRKDKRIPDELQNELFQYISIRQGLKNPELFNKAILSNPSIKQNIKNIINNYFSNENLIQKRLETSESFIGAIINNENGISEELRNKLYNYFTKTYFDKEHFFQCMRIMFNKITENNSILFIDNIIFMISRNIDIMSYEVFKLLILRESTSSNEKAFIMTIFSNPIGRKDLVEYFHSINVDSIKTLFMENILKNYENWINLISNSKEFNQQEDLEQFITNAYAVLMMIFGISYSYNIFKSKINKVIIDLLHKDINIIKSLGIFLIESDIHIDILDNINKLDDINTILRDYINKYYFSKDSMMKDKIIVENILENFLNKKKDKIISIRNKEIDLFLSEGYFIKTNKLSIEEGSHKTNFINVSKDEYDKEEDEQEVEEDEQEDEYELEEPNEEILENIKAYFKNPDKKTGQNDLEYYIEKNKIRIEDFTYGLVYSLIDRKTEESDDMVLLIKELEKIKNYEKIFDDFNKIIKTNENLIKNLKSENMSLEKIIKKINKKYK